MNQIAKIYLEVYPFYLFLCVCEDPKAVDGLLRQYGYHFTDKELEDWNKPEMADCRAVADKLAWRPYDTEIQDDAPRGFLIWIRRPPRNNAEMADVIHEVSHIASHVLMYISHPPSFENDEPEAYLIDYIAEKVLNVLKPESRRVRRV